MMTDKQLKTLMQWVQHTAKFVAALEMDQGRDDSLRQLRDNVSETRGKLYEAFGFAEGEYAWPVVPHPDFQAVHDEHAVCKSCGEQFRMSQGHTCTGIAAKPVCSNCGQVMGVNHVCTAVTVQRDDMPSPATLRQWDGKPVQAGDLEAGKAYELATSDPKGHQEAIASADYDAKEEAIRVLLRRENVKAKMGVIAVANAADIMRVWPELKAIMEPNAGAQDAIASADYEAKREAITDILRQRSLCNFTYPEKAAHIMSVWPELKAIMEPNAGAQDASLIESLIRRYSRIPDGVLERMAQGETPAGYEFTSANTALAVLAARARLK